MHAGLIHRVGFLRLRAYCTCYVSGEVGKQLAEYKFRAQKAEQDVATLQATVARLESQVIRYKSAAEVSEKSEEVLKAEKRKLQREVSGELFSNELSVSNRHRVLFSFFNLLSR